jgi:hypothetical protein
MAESERVTTAGSAMIGLGVLIALFRASTCRRGRRRPIALSDLRTARGFAGEGREFRSSVTPLT